MNGSARVIVIGFLAGLALVAGRAGRPTNRAPLRSVRPQHAKTKVVPPASALPQLELDELLKPVPPKEPAEALKSFETLPGFHMELAAHEPAVVDPVAAAFDEQGRLFVAEMRDYP